MPLDELTVTIEEEVVLLVEVSDAQQGPAGPPGPEGPPGGVTQFVELTDVPWAAMTTGQTIRKSAAGEVEAFAPLEIPNRTDALPALVNGSTPLATLTALLVAASGIDTVVDFAALPVKRLQIKTTDPVRICSGATLWGDDNYDTITIGSIGSPAVVTDVPITDWINLYEVVTVSGTVYVKVLPKVSYNELHYINGQLWVWSKGCLGESYDRVNVTLVYDIEQYYQKLATIGYQSIATSGGTTALTATDKEYIIFTGTQDQTVTLPNATTLAVGRMFKIDNDSTGELTVNYYGGAAFWKVASGCDLYITCTGIATTAGTWEKDYSAAKALTGKSLTINNRLTLAGTDGTTMTLPAASTTLAGLNTVQTFTAGQAGEVTNLTSSSGSIAINLADSNNFKHTFTESTTLAAPSNAVEGQSGIIYLTQHASSPKTLAYNTFWKFAGGTVPAVTATNSAADKLVYSVDPGATSATCALIKDVK